ncbi:MAG TPA: type I methionyl aminopeptidase [Thermoanaerobaculia bacterium]|nr:type I methionyl aminopeptidase [Thermoanaerobaculia bacterium]
MTIGSKEDLAGMKRVGRLVGEALREMKAAARPGMTTAELDAVGADWLRRQGARSAPQLTYGFPGFNLISVNEQIVHGVPGPRRLEPGDVVKIDVTAELGGYIADAALTVVLPPVSPAARNLRRCVRSAFEKGMAAARTGSLVSAIGRAVDREVRRHGCSVIRNLCGHGVGRTIHEAPSVPNYYDPQVRDVLTEGLVIALEPMVSVQPARTVEEPDGWTLRTHNRSLAAHYEHTIVITRGEPLVLTAA